MRKKFSLLALAICSMMALTACGSKEDVSAPITTPVVEEVASEEVATTEGNIKVGEVDTSKGKVIATVSFDEKGNPLDITFDRITPSGKSDYERAVSGIYVMAEGSTPLNEQMDTLASFIKENNFDLTNVDAVTGVSINASSFIQAAEIALGK